MPFDPCGTRKLEGEDILARLALYLDVNPKYLKTALQITVNQYKSNLKDLEENH